VLERVLDRLVGVEVELLLDLALDVLRVGAAEDVDEPGPPDGGGDDLGRERDVVQEVGELARGFRVLALLLEDEPFDGGH